MAALSTASLSDASAQLPFDVPLGSGTPVTFEGPAIVASDGFALFGGGALHLFLGLPHNPNVSSVPLMGPMAPVSRWHQLSADAAVFRAVGADLAPETADDPLVFVTGLPMAPVLHTSTITGISADFQPINSDTAVQVQPAGFVVIKFAPTSAISYSVPVPNTLVQRGAFKFGPIDEDTLAGMSVGSDGLVGTGDDEIVILSGLLGGPPYTTTTRLLPSGIMPSGFLVTTSRIACVVEMDAPPDVRLTYFPGPLATVAPITIVGHPLANPSPFLPAVRSVRRGPGDAMIVSCEDDVGPGIGHALLTGFASGAAQQVFSWYDDQNSGSGSELVDEYDIARFSAVGPTGFSYARVDPASSFSFNFNQSWSIPPGFVKTCDRSLATFTETPFAGSSQAMVTVFKDLGPNQTTNTFAAFGHWGGGGLSASGEFWPPRFVALPRTMVAGFISPPGPTVGPPTMLRIITTPSVNMAAAGMMGTPTPALLTFGLPSLIPAAPLLATIAVPSTFGPTNGWIWAAHGLSAPQSLPAPIFLPGSLAHLDLATLLAEFPVSMPGGTGQISIDIGPALFSVAGIPIYFQGLVADPVNSTYAVSDAIAVVLG